MAAVKRKDRVPGAPVSTHRGYVDDSPWRMRFVAIHRQLRERITLLHYPPATRLDVDALAAEFGVSRTPIRTVLQQLEREGLAITRHGVGTTVTDIDHKHLRESTLLRMHLAGLIGLLEPRRPTDDLQKTLARLRQECSALPSEIAVEQFSRIDMRLHECICDLIGNDPLREIYDQLYFSCARMWFYFLPHMDWQTEVSALLRHIDMMLWAASRNDALAIGSIIRDAVFQGLYRLRVLISPGDSE